MQRTRVCSCQTLPPPPLPQVAEYKYEIDRLTRELADLKRRWFDAKTREAAAAAAGQQQQRGVACGGGGGGGGLGALALEGGGGGGGASIKGGGFAMAT